MKNRFLLYIILALCIGTNALSQTKIYYYASDYSILTSEDSATYKKYVEEKSKKRTVVNTYEKHDEVWLKRKKEAIRNYGDSVLVIKRSADNYIPQVILRSYSIKEDNLIYFTDRVKNLIIAAGTTKQLIPLQLQDTVWSFYSNSNIKSIAIYEDNKLISNKNWLKNGKAFFDNIYLFVDNLPQPSMSRAKFRAYIKEGIRDSGIDLNQMDDEVKLAWVVTADGDPAGIHVVSGSYSDLNDLLISLIENLPGGWIPAKLDGKPVNFYQIVPFNFINDTDDYETSEFDSGFVLWD